MTVSTCGHALAPDGHYHPVMDKGTIEQILCCACVGCKIVPKVPGDSEDTVSIPRLHPGEINELHTRQLIRETHRNFLAIGKLLRESRENAYWSTAGKWESFSDYIESLGISKSAGYGMIACYEFQSVGKLTEDEILEIGIAKMGILTSAGRQGKITDEVITLAKVAPVRDLKEHLGHKVIENDPNYSIICPHCGVAIEGAEWVRSTTKGAYK